MEDSAKVNLEHLRKSKDFCKWLRDQEFSEAVVKSFEEEDIGGLAFLDLTEDDLKEMRLKKGPLKDLLRLQKEHKLNLDQTQVSIIIVYHLFL